MTRVANAERSVEEYLDLGLAPFGYRADIFAAELSCEDDSLATQIIRHICTERIVNGHLRRAVQLKVGQMAAQRSDETEVGYDKSVNTDPIKLSRIGNGVLHLSVENEGVYGNVYFSSVEMGVDNRAPKLLDIKVFCIGASAESFAPDVDGVRSSTNGGDETLKASCRSEKLGEFVFSFQCILFLKIGFL